MHIVDAENRSTTIKNVGPGENVSSLLSFVDVATGHPNVYRTVCCRAVADSVIVKLPSLAFRELFEQSPDTMIRVVQGGNSIDSKIIRIKIYQKWPQKNSSKGHMLMLCMISFNVLKFS